MRSTCASVVYKLLQYQIHLRLRRLNRDTILYASEPQPASALRARWQRNPEFGLRIRKLEALRHHTDNRIRLAVTRSGNNRLDQNGAAKNIGIASKISLPRAVAQDGH